MYSKATWVLLSSGTQILPQKILNPDYLSFPFLETMFVISNINGKSWLVGIYPFIMTLRKLCWNAVSHRNFPLILSKISSLFLGSFFSNVLSSTHSTGDDDHLYQFLKTKGFENIWCLARFGTVCTGWKPATLLKVAFLHGWFSRS